MIRNIDMTKNQLKLGKKIIAAFIATALLPTSLQQPVFAKTKNKRATDENIELRLPSTSDSARLAAQDVASSLPASSLRKYGFTFKQLGAAEPFQLRGVDPIYSLPFSIPADEVVTALKVKLDFTYSPSLITNLSHLKIMLNGEVAATVQLPKEQSGTSMIREVSIDPRLVTDFNKLSLQFIGHYTLDCEDPFHSSLWLNVSNLSSVEFTVTPLSVINDLALLPAPFFDRRDSRRLELPFVFGAAPSASTLEAAGIVSSWFGSLASYRGAWFPANLNTLPADDVVVMATNDDKPAGLTLPAINGPTLSIASHPADVRYKILYVLGRDAAELRTAAMALGLGRSGLSGPTVTNAKIDDLKKRVPYDAPAWVPTDRPVKFGELASDEDLNVASLYPDLIRVNLRLPPDLFGWRSDGIPVDLSYRYTPRPRADKSNLNILVNKNFVNSYPLLPYPGAGAGDATLRKFVASLLPNKLLPSRDELFLPVAQIPARSQLQFHFSFDYPKEGSCKDVKLDNVRAAIDPDSTIDISHFPHYIKMPNLSAFANAGFPFTRMADLSETAIILPDTLSVADIGTYLTVMGRMGESTGLASYGVTVAKAADINKHADKDIMLLGSTTNQPLLSQWAKHMPFSAAGEIKTFSLSDYMLRLIPWYQRQNSDNSPVAKLTAVTLTKEAVLFGFESPLKNGRSVVAMVSDRTTGLADVLSALMDVDVVSKIHGSLAVVRSKDVDSLEVGNSYYLGSLPLGTAIRWFFANNPWLMAVFLLLGAIIAGGVAYTLLRFRATKRLKG
jgi:cellulose synthase operon protein B